MINHEIIKETELKNSSRPLRNYMRELPAWVVLVQGTVGKWFHTSVGVRQGCLLSPTLFNIFLECIMTDALEDHNGTVSIGGRRRTITNLSIHDDIDGLAGNEQELADLVKCLDKTSSKYGMETNAEKTKIMTNSAHPITTKITVRGKELERPNTSSTSEPLSVKPRSH